MKPMCRHCGREVVSRPRGLGWRCYYTPGLRDRYPMSNHPSARRETPDGFRTPPPCPEPTPHLQGTPGKIAVLAARAAAGVALFHPDDNTGED